VPKYIEMQTDYTGCTLFGGGKLVRSYRRWLEFRDHYPAPYRRFVAKALSAIEEEMDQGACACGEGDRMAEELSECARSFPKSVAAEPAAVRARAIRTGTSSIRFKCETG
jgi:hypothetical protein